MQTEYAEKIGFAVTLMAMSKEYRTAQVALVKPWIEQALVHNQLKILFSPYGEPHGYYSWARISSETEQRLLKDKYFALHPSEWNDGDRIWIIDFCFPRGTAKLGLNSLLSRFFGSNINWVRRRDNYTIFKKSHITASGKYRSLTCIEDASEKFSDD